MAQGVRVSAAKPEDPRFILRATWWKARANSYNLSSDLYKHPMAHVCLLDK